MYLASPSAVCPSSRESAPSHHEADKPDKTNLESPAISASWFTKILEIKFQPGGSQKSRKFQIFQLGGAPNKPKTRQPNYSFYQIGTRELFAKRFRRPW